MESIALEKDDQGQVYQEQSNNKDKPTSYLPYIFGGIGIILVVGIIVVLIRKKRKSS